VISWIKAWQRRINRRLSTNAVISSSSLMSNDSGSTVK